ncbi:MAG: DUF1015 domain-containing protein [Spirochaetales bacterium]|nr:DUF1015 domain-containing protein [Spirochaetales bacterium]
MVKIKPFKGILPAKDLLDKVVAPPYDVLSFGDCKNLTENNKYSLIHITRSEADFPDGTDPYSQPIYDKAKENLEAFLKNGILVQDPDEYYYVYRQTMNGRTQTGFFCAASAYDYMDGIIKKHENTRKDKEDDRIRHIKTTNCQCEPVFLAYKYNDALNVILKNAVKSPAHFDFGTPDGTHHELWKVTDKNVIAAITAEFAKLDCLYIADGHHRSAAATNYCKAKDAELGNTNRSTDEEYQYFMSVVFPDKDLYIYPYNRVIKKLPMTMDEFMNKVGEKFTVTKVNANDGEGYTPKNHGEVGLYINGSWYCLKYKGTIDKTDPVGSLDVAVLQNNILSPILGINDPRTDKNIDFIGGIKGSAYLKGLVDSGEMCMAFSMYPTSIDELFAVADKGLLMPPKSTWFEPKLLSGVMLHKLD